MFAYVRLCSLNRWQISQHRPQWDSPQFRSAFCPPACYEKAVRIFHDFRIALRACIKMKSGPVFVQKAGWRGATNEHIPSGSVSEEQRSQAAFCAKTLRAARLLSVAGVGSLLIPTRRDGDARNSPSRPAGPKSAAAGPLLIFKQALIILQPGPGLPAQCPA